MNYQQRGLGFSLLIHAAALLVFFGLSHSMARFSKPLLIDFSIEDSAVKGDLKAAPAARHQEVRTVKPEPPKPFVAKPEPPKQVVAKQEIPQEKPVPSQEVATSETSPESQAPVAARPVTGASSETSAPSPAGSLAKAEGQSSSGAGNGNSTEALKQGYLKEHFAYIRDIVQRKLRYPKIARRMGWEGKVIISFIVCVDGHARDITVKKGSGIELLDRNAVTAVQMASPFPRPPAEAQLIIPISYALN
jgi:protein TonB